MAFDGNPVFWADPSGADAIITSDGITFDGEDALSAFNGLLNFLDGEDSSFNITGMVVVLSDLQSDGGTDGGDGGGDKLSGGKYNGKNSGDITNKRDFNGFTLDVREVTNLSHEEAFNLFENVFKERQTMFDNMMEWIDKSGYVLAADVKTLLEELKKGNPLRLSTAAMMEYAKWKTSKVSSQNEGVFKAYVDLHVKETSQMKGIIQIYERFGVSLYHDVTVHYYDRSTGKYLGKVD